MIDLAKLDELLTGAAARGVAVTIIANEHDAPPLRFKWRIEEKWWGAVATFSAAGFVARVWDKDGDASEWELKCGKVLLAEGGTYDCQPYYHFDACLLAAEGALLTAARERYAAIKALRESSEKGR
jgi:hypothetical protein